MCIFTGVTTELEQTQDAVLVWEVPHAFKHVYT